MPNTLKFSVPVDNKSELFKKINTANLGVMIHTKFTGSDLKKLTADFNVNLSRDKNITQVSSVFVMDARPENITDKIIIPGQIRSSIESKLRIVQSISKQLGPSEYARVKTLLREIEPYVNARIRAGAERLDVTRAFISSILEKSKSKLSSEKAKKERDEIVSNNLNVLKSIVVAYKLLFQIKLEIVNAINILNKKIKTFAELQQDNVFEPTNPEGYLIVNAKQKTVVKLVDRFTFSKINFRKHPIV